MKDAEFKDFEKSALAFLRTVRFTPSGFYRYEHGSDFSGSIIPPPPFTLPLRTMVEVARNAPNKPSIEGFHKLARDSLTQREIVISPVPFGKLDGDTQATVRRHEIEFFDQDSVRKELEQKKVDASQIQEYFKLYESLGPRILAKNLPAVARQSIPSEIAETVSKLKLEPWQVFEDSVFAIFHYCLGFETRKLGRDTLFEHEPEGVVLVGETGSRYATLYECKSAHDKYEMTSDHELRYRDYIKEKKRPLEVLDNASLRYFLIIGPDFRGDLKERRQSVHDETGVWTVFMPASILSSFAQWAESLPNQAKKLLDLKPLFKIDELIVSEKTVTDYRKNFEEKTRGRW